MKKSTWYTVPWFPEINEYHPPEIPGMALNFLFDIRNIIAQHMVKHQQLCDETTLLHILTQTIGLDLASSQFAIAIAYQLKIIETPTAN